MSCLLLLLLTLSLFDARPPTLADARPPGLADLWAAEMDTSLGEVEALAPITAETLSERSRELRAPSAALDAAHVESVAPGDRDAVGPLPPLSIEGHRDRVQSLASWSAARPSAEPARCGSVSEVIDAKTFLVQLDDASPATRVALYGVQTPREGQPFAQEALAFVRERLAGVHDEVVVIPVTTSEGGRSIYSVVLTRGEDGRMEPLGEMLLRHGLAWWGERHAALDGRLKALHYAAVDRRIGCFSRRDAISPGAYRNLQRKAGEGYVFDGEVVTCRVVRATDGDTLDVVVDDVTVAAIDGLSDYVTASDEGNMLTIRVAGIDTPEIDQPGGVQAWAISHLACGGREVQLVLLDDGGYGRLAGRVVCPDGEVLGEKLVRMGRARHYEYYVPDERLEDLENRARHNAVGLWGAPGHVIPGMWRELQKDVLGHWSFEDDGHLITVDADGDPSTTDDQRRVSSSDYKTEIAHDRFEELCDLWSEELSPHGED